MNDRDHRFPPGWWIIPTALIGALFWLALFWVL